MLVCTTVTHFPIDFTPGHRHERIELNALAIVPPIRSKTECKCDCEGCRDHEQNPVFCGLPIVTDPTMPKGEARIGRGLRPENFVKIVKTVREE